MICHTQFLKTILVLVTLCLPIGLGVNLSYFISSAVKKKKLSIDYLGMIISYSIILVLSILSGVGRPFDTNYKFDVLAIFVAIAAGLLCIGVEYLIGVLMTFHTTKRWIFKISVHSVYSDTKKLDAWDVLAVGTFVLLEEFVFRSAIINVLFEFGLPQVLVVSIAIIIFALNHVHWGLFVFIQKLFSGCIFVLLYVLFGRNIVIPVIAHLVQNFALLWLSRRAKNE
ncbi:CPBP family intramembrane glutamic endopeptidase [Enterococcus faecalis]|uniref:CPBP family intramembrane glutamic endopeptidase n=1 Tax=Enterococcus faecalis TaxID=1351 RepID=UPI002DB8AEF2|nr:CPBP family intramembrane glutamic endopeptidase [Enterococcus faecalis]MEB7954576.1 CPBP family intramembrane metalloprotease [Enterococcus faecalis]MEB7964707.1 CPBP family intramembrane metalloprotease [Enterococcus faecalis]